MKSIILVGGYATRMGNLTKNIPKALLKIKGDTVLDLILERIILDNSIIDEYILVTNDTFYQDFINWKKSTNYQNKITIISDGSTSNSNKIGATSAIIKTIKELKIEDDIFILAGDNLIDFSLQYIFDLYMNTNDSYIMYYQEDNLDKLKKTGVITLEDDMVIEFQEKPKEPKTNYAVPPFYFLRKKDIKLLLDLFQVKEKVDSMGEIIKLLCNKTRIKGIRMKGNRYDIGSIEEYQKLL